jgi:hypothetical protein
MAVPSKWSEKGAGEAATVEITSGAKGYVSPARITAEKITAVMESAFFN